MRATLAANKTALWTECFNLDDPFGWISARFEPVPRIVYNQQTYFLLVGSGTTTAYSPSNIKFSLKYFNIF